MYAIRSPQENDLPAICALLDACALPSSDLQPEHLRHFLVVKHGLSVIACVGLEVCGPDALLRSLAVAHMHRGGGFGARMTSAIEEHARQQGITRLYLLTTTAADFFERDAYQPIDRAGAPPAIQATSQFSTLCPASSTCLFKSIA